MGRPDVDRRSARNTLAFPPFFKLNTGGNVDKSKTDWAHYWHGLGFSVVPVHYVLPDGSCSCAAGKDCPSPGKHPAPDRWKRYQNKRADKDTLEIWFDGRFKNYNLGVVTGKISGNVFVLDVDVGEGKPGPENLDDLCMANDDLPDTLEQITGSGGKHYFFRAPEDAEIITGKDVLGRGLDTRGEGGFVVVAPSNHKSGNLYNLNGHASHEIEASPEWLRNLALTSNRFDADSSLQDTTTDRWGDLTDGREGYMVQLILGTIRTWWTTKGELPTVEQLIDDAWPTYRDKVLARGRDLDSDGRGMALFQKKCWYQLQRAKNNELRILQGVAAGSEMDSPDLTSPVDGQGAAVLPPVTPSLRLTDWGMNRYLGEAPEQEWLIENILPRRIPGLLASIGGLGKSFVLLDLCVKVAGGDQELHQEYALGGRVAQNGKVVMLGAEDSANSVHRRIQSICTPAQLDRAMDNLFVVPLPDAGGPVPLIHNLMGQYSATAQYMDIRQQLVDMGDVALIVIDPLQAFAHADINQDPAAGQFWWSLMAELCATTDSTAIVAHHMRKEGTFSIKKSSQAREAIRGTTALVDGARWAYALWNMPEEEETVVAANLMFESGVGNCVMGGVVKVNDEADKSTVTYIRGDNGLLTDRTAEVSAILDASVKLNRMQIEAIFTEIETRWLSDTPLTAALNTNRSLQAHLIDDYGMPKRAARSYVQAWQDNRLIESATHDGYRKTKGLRVIRRPDYSVQNF